MIGIRMGGEELWLEEAEWRLWIEDGRIPPDALVLATGGNWVPAGMLPVYRQLRAAAPAPAPAPEPGVLEVVFPRRGLSATEVLLLVNILVWGVLTAAWSAGYSARLFAMASEWWGSVSGRHGYGWWVPTLFLHAGFRHLGANMVSLVATAGAIEYLTGPRWTIAAYLLTGIGGAAVSYVGHDGPPLSVGASGAIFGLAGAAIAFLIRRYRSFPYRQRWKARRVYPALVVLLVLPSLLNADWMAHVGGFVTGLLIGGFLPPHERVRRAAETDPHAEP